jgi:hypothetical protein
VTVARSKAGWINVEIAGGANGPRSASVITAKLPPKCARSIEQSQCGVQRNPACACCFRDRPPVARLPLTARFPGEYRENFRGNVKNSIKVLAFPQDTPNNEANN